MKAVLVLEREVLGMASVFSGVRTTSSHRFSLVLVVCFKNINILPISTHKSGE